MRPVTRSTSSHPPRCHCQCVPESSGTLSFTRNTRRTTNQTIRHFMRCAQHVLLYDSIHQQRAYFNRHRFFAVEPSARNPLCRCPFAQRDHMNFARRFRRRKHLPAAQTNRPYPSHHARVRTPLPRGKVVRPAPEKRCTELGIPDLAKNCYRSKNCPRAAQTAHWQ